jgi:hypothetical protein
LTFLFFFFLTQLKREWFIGLFFFFAFFLTLREKEKEKEKVIYTSGVRESVCDNDTSELLLVGLVMVEVQAMRDERRS